MLTVCILCCAQLSKAQSGSFENEWRFGKYLLDKSQYADAIKVLSRMDQALATPLQKDSLHYLIGWAAYQSKKLELAATSLLKVSPDATALYNKSLSFGAYSLAFLNFKDSAAVIFNKIVPAEPIEQELIQFELAGLALLNKDFEQYDQLRKYFKQESYIMQQEEKRFERYRDELANTNTKSPFLAGLYSAVLPGAGKWYAGKRKQGVAAFLPIVSLAAITLEAYKKGGIKDARFITFGSLFSLFYVGNIWGSVFSVKIKQKEFNKAYEHKILFDMHIPLRNFYN